MLQKKPNLKKRKVIVAELRWIEDQEGVTGWVPTALSDDYDNGSVEYMTACNPRSRNFDYRDLNGLIHDIFHHEALKLPYINYGEALAESISYKFRVNHDLTSKGCRQAAAHLLRYWRGDGYETSFSEWKQDVKEIERRAYFMFGWINNPVDLADSIEDALRNIYDEDTMFVQDFRMTINLETHVVKMVPVGGWVNLHKLRRETSVRHVKKERQTKNSL